MTAARWTPEHLAAWRLRQAAKKAGTDAPVAPPAPAAKVSELEEAMAELLADMGIAFDREQCLLPGRDFRCDFQVRGRKIVIECEGLLRGSQGRHQSIVGMSADCVKYNALGIAGYLVLRFTGRQIKSEKELVRTTIRAAMDRTGD